MESAKEKAQLLRDAAKFKKTYRIPTHSNYWTYMILESGHTLGEALYDNELLTQIVCNFHEKYEFDFYNYTGGRNPVRAADAVDGNTYIINDETEALNIKDCSYIEDGEYPELAANPLKFYWEKYLPRKCGKLAQPAEIAAPAFAESARELSEYKNMTANLRKLFAEKYQIPSRALGYGQMPIELLFNQIRGIKALSVDLRRRKEEVIAVCHALEDFNGYRAALNAAKNREMPDNTAFLIGTCCLAHSIMSVKQYEEFYWPWMKPFADVAVEKDGNFLVFCESFFGRHAEFYQDIPKGVLLIQPEQDDPFELRRQLPNAAICGGMKSTLLGSGTKEAVLDFAKKLVDELGRDGGFIMGQDKMMTYRNDAKPENILAVQEFCRNYKG